MAPLQDVHKPYMVTADQSGGIGEAGIEILHCALAGQSQNAFAGPSAMSPRASALEGFSRICRGGMRGR